jgi:hypothetical protein
LALSSGNNRATTRFLNASPYRAILDPYRPQVERHIEATTILTVAIHRRPTERYPILLSALAANTAAGSEQKAVRTKRWTRYAR